jgi:hypothetical protein
MKRYLLIFCLILVTPKLFAQQFGQYNTGTLYDSFENPAQRSFIPDSSRMYASNFFFPNLDGNVFLTGDAQQTLKERLVLHKYINSNLIIGGPGSSAPVGFARGLLGDGFATSPQIGSTGHLNYLDANADVYALMFKMFTSLDGDQEVGFFLEGNSTVRGVLTDESVALLNGSSDFTGTNYSNVLNSRYHYQAYYQFGASYRERITKRFSIGIKAAFVSGMTDENVNIRASHITFNKAADSAVMNLGGSNTKAGFSTLPFSNPGADISIGTEYQMKDAFTLQVNLKDLGFIHWNKHAEVYYFFGNKTIYGLNAPNSEKDVLNAYNSLIQRNKFEESYNTLINGSFEVGLSKSVWIDDDRTFKYAPSVILSKDLAYNSFTGGLVNPVYYKDYSLSVITSYNDMKLFDFGLQFMYKNENAEFFIASDRFPQSISFLEANLKNQGSINSTGAFSGGDLMIGFTLKFGDVIEHPMNANKIPMGDDKKGFLGRIYQSIFHPHEGTIQNN